MTRRVRTSRRRGDDGVTLVEVLVAGIVLLITMIPMGILLANATSAAAQSRQREAAVQLADSWVEILANSQPPTGTDGAVLTNSPSTPVAPPGTVTPPTTLAGTTYSTTAEYVEASVDDVGQSDLCSSGEPPSPSHPGVIELLVVVTWDGNQTVSDSTEINYPKPGLQTEGFLAINVTNDGVTDVHGNSAVTRLQAVPVTITQDTGNPVLVPSSFTLYADPNGCIFAQVPVGTYTVSVNQPTSGTPKYFTGFGGSPAFVSTAGATSENQSPLTVTVTAENVVQLDAFDEGIIGNVSYGGSAAIDSGVQCPGTARMTCVTTGSQASGGSSAWGGAGSSWSTATLAAGTHVNQVACTTSATCVGVGYGSTGGLIVSTATNLSSTSSDAVPPGVTDIAQVVCPSSAGCYGLATTSSGPALLAGYVGTGTDNWAVVTPPGFPISTMNSIACPTASTCDLTYTSTTNTPGVVRLDGDPAGLSGNSAWVPTSTADVLPTTVSSIGAISCPTTTDCEAIATGDLSSPLDATVVTAPIAAAGADTWTSESTFPTGASSVTDMSCTSSTCVAIGSLPVSGVITPVVWTGDLTTDPHSWVQANSFPTTFGALTSVACGQPTAGDSADCVVAGTTEGAAGVGQLVDGSLTGVTGGSWAWNTITPPGGIAVQFYDSVACQTPPSASAATCAAVGATLNGPVVLSSASGPDGTWANVTPSSFPGAMVTGIPIESAPAGTTSWTVQVPAGHANVSVLPNVLYPEAGGYSLSAGDCPGEGDIAPSGTLTAPPGGTASTTVPLGLLTLQLMNSSGSPVSGASITLTSTTCGVSNADSYNLPVTDGYGLTTTSVPYGSYSYSVTIGGSSVAHTTVDLTVGASTVAESINGVSTTTYLPGPVQVAA